MTLTKEQLRANELFFIQVASVSKSYFWPHYGFLFTIDEDGCYISPSKRAREILKDNTPKTFHHKIK